MKKKAITFKLQPWLIDGLDMYRDLQEVAPDRTAVVETVIRKFLEEHGISKDAAERQDLHHAGQ